ncbi:(4Fe-4S)-binding protein, partial [Ruegeria sp. NA]|nr:(4Fe-4S)-binding protein [Ruegeria sp. NA]
MGTKLLLCDCAGTQALDPDRIACACGITCSKMHTALCTNELQSAAALMQEGDTVIACLQEQEVFRSLAEDMNIEIPGFVDLRDRAGWSEQGADATAKMAALAAEAFLPQPVTPSV